MMFLFFFPRLSQRSRDLKRGGVTVWGPWVTIGYVQLLHSDSRCVPENVDLDPLSDYNSQWPLHVSRIDGPATPIGDTSKL